MSRRLLLALNGVNNGALRKWLAEFDGEPRIAWYPSAGQDFRDLLYFHPRCVELYAAHHNEPSPPDIFLHTDYLYYGARFLWNHPIYRDNHTSVSLERVEELPRCHLPLDGRIVVFPRGSPASGRVFYLEMRILSDSLGELTARVIYAIVENAAFCAERVLPCEGRLSHIIHWRHGGGCGGGGLTHGAWLLNVLRQVHCEVFLTQGHACRCEGDDRIHELYPSLAGDEDESQLDQIRTYWGWPHPHAAV
jgi:hypothetical protein